MYSGTSDKGPSEIGTASLQGTLLPPRANIIVYYLTSEIGTASQQGTRLLPRANIIVYYLRDSLSTKDITGAPKVSLVRRLHLYKVQTYYGKRGTAVHALLLTGSSS